MFALALAQVRNQGCDSHRRHGSDPPGNITVLAIETMVSIPIESFRDRVDSSLQKLYGMRLILSSVPVQCTLQAFSYPFGTPAAPFTVQAAVRRSSRHRTSSGDRAGS